MEIGGFTGIAALIVAIGGLFGIWATRGRDKGTLRMGEYDQLQENLRAAWERIDVLDKKLEATVDQLTKERGDNAQLRQDLDRANARIEHLEKQQASDHP